MRGLGPLHFVIDLCLVGCALSWEFRYLLHITDQYFMTSFLSEQSQYATIFSMFACLFMAGVPCWIALVSNVLSGHENSERKLF